MTLSDLVLIGGGHAHVHLLKMYGMPPYKSILTTHGIRCTLITSDIQTPYSGMLPGMVAGHYSQDEIHIDLQRLCSFSHFRLIHASATGIVMNHNGQGGGYIECSDGRPPVRFDVLSIDVGSSPSLPSGDTTLDSTTDTVDEKISIFRVIPVKPIAGFSNRWKAICTKLERMLQEQLLFQTQQHSNQPLSTLMTIPTTITSSVSTHLRFSRDTPYILAIVGGGAGGVELALATQYALQKIVHNVSTTLDDSIIKVVLVTRGHTLLENQNNSIQSIFQRILQERNIDVRYNSEAVGIEEYKPSLGLKKFQWVYPNNNSSRDQDDPILFHDCLWCTSASAPTWIARNTPLETDSHGFIKVNSCYESMNIRGVFAAGDCCHMVENPRPKGTIYFLSSMVLSF